MSFSSLVMPLKLCKKALGCQGKPLPARGCAFWPLPSHRAVMGIMPARCEYPVLLALNAWTVSHLPCQGMSQLAADLLQSCSEAHQPQLLSPLLL